LRKQERSAIEAVAEHFAATWESGNDSRHVRFSIGGTRITVAVTTIRQRVDVRSDLPKPRLRFDKVAVGFVRRLHDGLYEAVPAGKMLVLTITAPILMPSQTAAVLEDTIRACLARRSVPAEAKQTINGNQINVRLVKNGLRGSPKVVGFVHNPESEPAILLDTASSLIEHIAAAVNTSAAAGLSGDRWLVLVNEGGPSHIETYRAVYSQLSIPTDFRKILIVFAGNRVETLADGVGDRR
jgi:hypothetical protein